MGDGLMCHYCRKYNCVCDDEHQETRILVETAIKIVQEEEELDGPIPETIWEEVKTKEDLAKILRATVKVTKNNIIKRLRNYL